MVMKNYRETYGPVTLSYAVGRAAYSEPRENGHALRDYSQVEIALLVGGNLVGPEVAGVPEFADDFESGLSPVAGYLPWSRVDELRAALAARHGVALQEPTPC